MLPRPRLLDGYAPQTSVVRQHIAGSTRKVADQAITNMPCRVVCSGLRQEKRGSWVRQAGGDWSR